MRWIVLGIALALASGCGTRDLNTVEDHVGDAEKCSVHGETLYETVVPISYGLPRDQEYAEARKTQFPKADEPYLGGCCVGPKKRARVSVCPKCNKARDEWREANAE